MHGRRGRARSGIMAFIVLPLGTDVAGRSMPQLVRGWQIALWEQPMHAARIWIACVIAATVAGPLGFCVPRSLAQSSIGMGFGPSGGYKPELSKRDVGVIARTLRLSDAERAALDTLYDGYVGELDARSIEVKAFVADYSEKAEAMRDLTLIDPARKRLAEWDKETEKIQLRFMEDLKSLLTREQEARWPILERELRRLKRIGSGRLPSESVDLGRLTEDLLGDVTPPTGLGEVLEEYAAEVDRAIVARDAAINLQDEFTKAQEADFEKAKGMWEDARRARRNLVEVNRRFARRIGEVLGPELAARLEEAFFRASYGIVFETTRTERFVTAAGKLASLDPAQRAEIDEAAAAYQRELAAWRRRAATAEEALIWETPPRSLAVKMGLIPEVAWRGESLAPKDHPVNEVRAERYELDKRFRERFTKILSKAQRQEISDDREGFVSTQDHLPWGL